MEEGRFRTTAQGRMIRKYCETVELDCMLMLKDERVTAATPLEERLGGRDLLHILASEGARHLVVWRLDRLFRTGTETVSYLDDWKERGITLHIADVNGMSIRTDSDAGAVFTGTARCLAEMERHTPSERARSDIALKKAHGFVYGITPYGFESLGNQLVPNEQEQNVLEQVRAWRQEGWGLRQIARELNSREVPTKRSASGQARARWYASTVRYLLANPIYGDAEEKTE
jgi:DNA invertase Pin-like site-specific DNA recombinase